MFNFLLKEVIIFMAWMGLWGLSDTIIQRYVAVDNFNVRIIIYFTIFLLSQLLLTFNGKRITTLF